MQTKPFQLRIEDACIWRKALAERPDEMLMLLLTGLRMIAQTSHPVARDLAINTLTIAGFESGKEEKK